MIWEHLLDNISMVVGLVGCVENVLRRLEKQKHPQKLTFFRNFESDFSGRFFYTFQLVVANFGLHGIWYTHFYLRENQLFCDKICSFFIQIGLTKEKERTWTRCVRNPLHNKILKVFYQERIKQNKGVPSYFLHKSNTHLVDYLKDRELKKLKF